MSATISEFPKSPQPHEPSAGHAPRHTPTPVVYERLQWEYQVVERKQADGAMNAEELNALGKLGWELTGTITTGEKVIFYFKRVSA